MSRVGVTVGGAVAVGAGGIVRVAENIVVTLGVEVAVGCGKVDKGDGIVAVVTLASNVGDGVLAVELFFWHASIVNPNRSNANHRKPYRAFIFLLVWCPLSGVGPTWGCLPPPCWPDGGNKQP